MGAKKIAETTVEADLIREISRVISDITGVQLGEKQQPLVQGRLSKRMRDLKISDPLEYARYYNANETIEIGILVSLMTTHHTFFFREFQHFEYLLKVSLPTIIKSHREKGLKTIRIWSAACSRGQEVYSISMFLKLHLPQLAPDMNYELVGSDICEESIAIAKNGVYNWDELRPVPSLYLQGNWSKGTGDIAQYVRAKDDLRKPTSFKLVNLIELEKSQPFGPNPQKFDVIFCRNVFIYFSHPQIKAITEQLLKNLNPAGHLFVGLSESLNGMGLPIEWVGPSVYEQKKTDLKAKAKPAAAVLPMRSNAAAPAPAGASAKPAPAPASAYSASMPPGIQPPVSKRLRVLCVDDSPTVLLLLKRILTSDKGFDIVGTASDGIEAAEKVKALKPDVMTLDIHMPRMTGVEFLEKHFKEIKTPVVVVSSVPRDDATLAYKCLEYGASDYIEKPSAANLDKVEEELIFKLRVAEESWRQANNGPTRSRASELDASFRRPPAILRPEGKLRVVVANFSSRDVVQVLMKGFTGAQPATVVLVEGAGDLFPEWVKKIATQMPGGKADEPKNLRDLRAGSISFMDMNKGAELLKKEGGAYTSSCLVVGPLSRTMVGQIAKLNVNHIIMEDRGPDNPRELMTKVRLVVPLTSFVYESDRFLAESGVRK